MEKGRKAKNQIHIRLDEVAFKQLSELKENENRIASIQGRTPMNQTQIIATALAYYHKAVLGQGNDTEIDILKNEINDIVQSALKVITDQNYALQSQNTYTHKVLKLDYYKDELDLDYMTEKEIEDVTSLDPLKNERPKKDTLYTDYGEDDF